VTKSSLIASRFPAHKKTQKIKSLHQINSDFSSQLFHFQTFANYTCTQLFVVAVCPHRHCFVSMQITTCDMAIVVTRANLTMQPKFLSLKLSERVSCSLSAVAAAHARAQFH
jgi:hypothetical protein